MITLITKVTNFPMNTLNTKVTSYAMNTHITKVNNVLRLLLLPRLKMFV